MDVRYRITKNIWHALFLAGGTAVFLNKGGHWIPYLSLTVLSLVFGLFLESVKINAAGDTKMCVATSVWLGVFTKESPYITVVALYVGYIFFILFVSYLLLIKKKGLKWTVRNQLYDFRSLILRTPLSEEKVMERFPGAVAILFATILSSYYLIL